ncbi:enoyl-CoA hydratase/isomerase family protein [Halalkalicoccus jeotgali]|uniref:3-hydroxybutyryl-CoA dehydratase n=1 Tax=Halalkalicoccus jeotgali (strain DSM 18796 / CECT 7217 / JCM 14584 / KCTC 4019 / B3) TaxID=795797 RepID=D8J3N1_HALJB|nr:enoyl-CoA hydratase/isomerase family protein [Halalkalicoccus jeotgali]ADJ15338.1 3-hydroxybutyryl-CoA dehydratase [Halalkalicoccus jeotgali B3]ELY35449.1 3-hydroxybutyryl-CoA dehydratase [Halalkalicoccus jeotgali B3]
MVSYTAYESISVDVEDSVATIEFHRPEVYNALNDEVMLDLSRAFDEIQLDRKIDAVVITGEGEDAFSAGADITEYAGTTEDHAHQQDRQELFYEMYRKALHCHAPVIAKINGYCVGGGLILAMFCDLRVAVEDAKFGVPTANIGQIPTGGANKRAIELVGEAKAKELVFTAGYVDAAEAERIGLINHAVAREELDETVQGIIDGIQDTGRKAVKNSKRALNYAADATDAADAREFEADLWWEQFATDERRELVDEFNEDE